MSLTLVNEFLCDPVYVLDVIDGDSLLIGEALWKGDERRPEFEDLVPDNWGAVAVVNLCEVVPDWRRTPLSPMLALRMLNVFAELDISAAALYAAPYNSSLRGAERAVASAKILAMWERAGFTRLYPQASPAEEFSHVMVRPLNASDIDRHVAALAGRDRVLRAAVED